MQQQQQRPGMFEQVRTGANCAAFVAQAAAVTVEVFLHRCFGPRYLGLQAAAGIILVLSFGLFFPGHDLRPLLGFLIAYILACFVARVGVLYRHWKGDKLHSYYTGRPTLQTLFPGWKETTIKAWCEPFVVFAAGYFVVDFSKPLGCYLIFAAASLFFTVNLTRLYERNRALDINDAVIGQSQIAARVREMQE